MKYVALLRGINVGGNNRVEMATLRATFESLGYADVQTYINSGNLIFSSDKDANKHVNEIESAIENDFGFHVHVVVRDKRNIEIIAKKIPKSWVNDATMKTDVMFLWEDVDNINVLDRLIIKPNIDEVQYISGAVVWRVDKDKVTRSGLMRLAGTPLYKKMTIRNVNTLRKLNDLMNKKTH